MATATITGFIHATAYGFEFFKSDDMGKYGYVLVAPHTITVEVPDVLDLNAGQLAALEHKRAAAMDEAAKAEKEMERLRGLSGKNE